MNGHASSLTWVAWSCVACHTAQRTVAALVGECEHGAVACWEARGEHPSCPVPERLPSGTMVGGCSLNPGGPCRLWQLRTDPARVAAVGANA